MFSGTFSGTFPKNRNKNESLLQQVGDDSAYFRKIGKIFDQKALVFEPKKSALFWPAFRPWKSTLAVPIWSSKPVA